MIAAPRLEETGLASRCTPELMPLAAAIAESRYVTCVPSAPKGVPGLAVTVPARVAWGIPADHALVMTAALLGGLSASDRLLRFQRLFVQALLTPSRIAQKWATKSWESPLTTRGSRTMQCALGVTRYRSRRRSTQRHAPSAIGCITPQVATGWVVTSMKGRLPW